MKLQLGDIVVNEWAGNTNPHKVLMFVRETRRTVCCLALDAKAVEFNNDDVLRLRKIGRLDIYAWRQWATVIKEKK